MLGTGVVGRVRKFSCLPQQFRPRYKGAMLNINIGWEWALGIVGVLILMAWNGSARFTALETSMEWVKRTLSELASIIRNGDSNEGQEAPSAGDRADEPTNLEAFLREVD